MAIARSSGLTLDVPANRLRHANPPEPAAYRVEVRIVVWESPDVLKVPTSALFMGYQVSHLTQEQRGEATQDRLVGAALLGAPEQFETEDERGDAKGGYADGNKVLKPFHSSEQLG